MSHRPIRFSSWTIFAHLWTFYTIILQFLHSLHIDRKLCAYFIMDFRSTHVFILMEEDISPNLSASGIINRRIHHTLLCWDKNKH
jgi:hypothetical protein